MGVVCRTDCPTLDPEALANRLGLAGDQNPLTGWPAGHTIGVDIRGFLFPGLSAAQTRSAWVQGLNAWMTVCGVRFALVTENSQTINIHPKISPIDGGQGVLAESEMPWRGIRKEDSLGQWYDMAEGWASLAVPVITHEVGHAIGFPHLSGADTALMNPVIGKWSKPSPLDIQYLAVPLYGPPKPAPKPAPGPPDLDLGIITITLKYRARLRSGKLTLDPVN